MPGFRDVRPTREMQYLQGQRDQEAEAQAAADPNTLTGPGFAARQGSGGGSGFGDVLKARAEYQSKFPAMRATAQARAAQAGDPGQAGVHESSNPGAEAGFFANFEMPHNDAPAMNFAPPGYVEAGHRRPEDADPLAEAQYQRDYNYQQIGRRGLRFGT
jgi:hypothetical protein